MDARTRVLTALDGGEPDRIPCAIGFYPVNWDGLGVPDYYRDGWIDVDFVRFPASPEEEAWRQMARPYSPDTRLGTPVQMANYDRWDYRPETPEHRNPLALAQSLDELRAFPFPDTNAAYDVKGLREQVERLHTQGLAVGGNLPHLGGELFESAWRLRGLENFLLDLIERPAWAHFLLDRLTEMACRNATTLARAGVDVLSLGDDVGMPGTMIIGPKIWRTFFKPRMASIIQAARDVKPDLRVMFHSDGNYAPILADLMDIGVNAIHPLQAEWMDATRLRRQFSPRLAFWGTIGRQTTFSFATPDAIRKEVRLRIETLGRAGLILSPAYDIDEPDISWENIAAFLEAAREFG